MWSDRGWATGHEFAWARKPDPNRQMLLLFLLWTLQQTVENRISKCEFVSREGALLC